MFIKGSTLIHNTAFYCITCIIYRGSSIFKIIKQIVQYIHWIVLFFTVNLIVNNFQCVLFLLSVYHVFFPFFFASLLLFICAFSFMLPLSSFLLRLFLDLSLVLFLSPLNGREESSWPIQQSQWECMNRRSSLSSCFVMFYIIQLIKGNSVY